jgi:predicted lipid-binding transport protein (Tim44 family)
MQERLRKGMTFAAVLLATVFVMTYCLELDAYARVGGGRSFGSRGSRPAYSPSKTSSSQYMASPSPGATSPLSQTTPQRSSMWGPLAGGLAGGLLGGMLFSSLGFGGHSGTEGGGIGFMDILLLGAILYFIYWFLKKRKAATTAAGGAQYAVTPGLPPIQPAGFTPVSATPPFEGGRTDGLEHIRQMDPAFDEDRFSDNCMDVFFKIQGAWGIRDMGSVRNLLTDEMYQRLEADAGQLKRETKITNSIIRRPVPCPLSRLAGERPGLHHRHLPANWWTIPSAIRELFGKQDRSGQILEHWTFTRPVGNTPWAVVALDHARSVSLKRRKDRIAIVGLGKEAPPWLST